MKKLTQILSVSVLAVCLCFGLAACGKTVAVTSVTISGESAIYVDTATTYTATVNPSNATDKTVTWAVIGGTAIATITSAGVLTATTTGTVIITATAGGITSEEKTITVTEYQEPTFEELLIGDASTGWTGTVAGFADVTMEFISATEGSIIFDYLDSGPQGTAEFVWYYDNEILTVDFSETEIENIAFSGFGGDILEFTENTFVLDMSHSGWGEITFTKINSAI
ncbi:MAG: Ig-like domain-containing protein [Christensenellaceae bacterium]|jgi:hypothetical protein|nr:Ig-like domain-containing protein [Christensenellaceae bacterium]